MTRKRATDGDDAEASQPTRIKRLIGAMCGKVGKRQSNRVPCGGGGKKVAVGLPWSAQGVGAQMDAVFFAIAADIEFDPVPDAGVDHPAIGRQVERNLEKPAVILQADHPLQANRSAAVDDIARHRPA